MDFIVNVIAVLSLVGGAGVATGHVVVGTVMPLLLLIGFLDGPNGGKRGE
jgi:hypothetical protein